MARDFPTLEDVPLPGVQGPRPVAGYDVSGYGRGAQALAQGVSNLGQGIEKSAQQIQEFNLYKLRNSALLAQDQILGDAINLREKYKHDQNFDTLQDRYGKDLDDLVQKGISNVPEGPLRDHVQARLQIPLARERASVEEQAFTGRKQGAHADLYDRANSLVQTTGPYEDPLHTAQVESFNSRADEYGTQGLMTPIEVQEHKQKLALRLADARARSRIDLGPEEAAKVEHELRNSIPRGGAMVYPPGGWGPTDHAASVISRAETGDATISVKALGNISPDKSGSKSYGFMGLNSGTGSASAFAIRYGRQFGLTARPGSAAFDQQWKDAAAKQPDAFRQAQLAYFNERVVPTIKGDLVNRGIPDSIASDPRVLTYFADRKIQMGIAGIDAVRTAWATAGGDAVRFMRNMSDEDRRNIENNFKTTLAERLYSPEGHETRLRTRLEGALATGSAAPPDMAERPSPQTIHDRNVQWVKPGAPYNTNLGDREPAFRQWVKDNKVPFDPDAKGPQDYDMRGFWKALQAGDEKAKSGIDPNDGKLHYPDYWKTPYHETFSNESQWATPDAPKWNDKDQLVDKTGKVIFDDRAANARPGEAPTGYTGDPLFAKLTPEHRDSLISHAEAVQRQYRTAADQQLKSNMADDLAAARTAGYTGKGRSLQEFTSIYGEEQGRAAFDAYSRQYQMAIDMYHLADKTPEERQAIVDYHMPNPEEPGYAERYKEAQPLLNLSQKLDEAQQKSAIAEKKNEVADLAKRSDDAVQEMLHTGKMGQGVTRDEFIRILGPEDGEAGWNAYRNAVQYATDRFHLPEQTPEEGFAVAHMYEPAPGQANVEKAWARVSELRQATDRLHEELNKDPAGYMLRYNPAVRDAYQTMQNAHGPDEAKAAQTYAETMIAEQKRFGVAPNDMKVVTDDYADNFKSNVQQMSLAGNDKQAWAAIKAEKDKWGPAWPQVYRQVAAGDPMLTVVGAGVKSTAGQLLVQYAKTKFGDIIKDEQSAHAKDIREALDNEMKPFANSLLGNAGGIAVYNTFRGQIEKLAAIYAFQGGTDAAQAAKQATDDVLNFKYDYRDGYRIPNSTNVVPAGVSSDDIQKGAAIAKMNLGKTVGDIDLAMRPHLDTFGGAYTADQLVAETADAKRNGRWTTNPDETGLAFIYGPAGREQAALKADGTPLQLTWQQLGNLAQQQRVTGHTSAAGFARALREVPGFEAP
jgi:YD repeat-containing protein